MTWTLEESERLHTRNRIKGLLPSELREVVDDQGPQAAECIASAAAKSTIAIELVTYASSSNDRWQRLLASIDRLRPVILKSDGSLTLTPELAADLKGRLKNVAHSHKEWVRLAFHLTHKNLLPDRHHAELTFLEIFDSLTFCRPPDGTHAPLLKFVVQLLNIAKSKNDDVTVQVLDEWLRKIEQATGISYYAIDAECPDLPDESTWRPVLEIAWKDSNLDGFECYLRWADLRHRIDKQKFWQDKRQQVSSTVSELENHSTLGSVKLNRLEITVRFDDFTTPWELQESSTLDDVEIRLLNTPTTLRLCSSCKDGISRKLATQLANQHFRSHDSIDSLTTFTLSSGFLCSTHHANCCGLPATDLHGVIGAATVAIWARTTFGDLRVLESAFEGKQHHELPQAIHNLRLAAKKRRDSVWRQIVLLYDPNLPDFEFSVDPSFVQQEESFRRYETTNHFL